MLYELNETEGCCGMCGCTFKTGDIVHELEVRGEVMTICDMCYKYGVTVEVM